jgi:hypothetical protein
MANGQSIAETLGVFPLTDDLVVGGTVDEAALQPSLKRCGYVRVSISAEASDRRYRPATSS